MLQVKQGETVCQRFHTWVPGEMFDSVYAPVISMTAVRLILAVAGPLTMD